MSARATWRANPISRLGVATNVGRAPVAVSACSRTFCWTTSESSAHILLVERAMSYAGLPGTAQGSVPFEGIGAADILVRLIVGHVRCPMWR